eukprot:TRINITY_DN14226_c0_g1_i5.p1 TRINITY_DN14226_c0_g1~~TRINITY_DN14226_c0_g1_i5.p1  ORF type:complete len:352 (-),score=73.41 TRINITY_DN14226_c0_g1_i5:76-1131(-)
MQPSVWLVFLFQIISIVSSTFICPGLGFYPDPSSCTAFYRCISLDMSYHYICPLGTRYDLAVKNCNHNHIASPCSDGVFPDLQEDISPETEQDVFPGLGEDISQELQEDVYPGLQGDLSNKPQEDVFPGVHEDISNELQEDVYPGEIVFDVQEDILPGLQGDISSEVQEDISTGFQEDTLNEPHEDKLPGNTNNGANTRPEQTTEHAQITEDQSLSKPNKPQQVDDKPELTFLVSPTSLYPCQQPGYFSEQSSCTQFYVCREVAPGVLSAEALFRCPNRYLFDVKTQLCQRKTKVACDKPDISFLFYAFRSSFVLQLRESELKQFFSQDLLLPKARIFPYPPLMFLPSHVY